MATDSSQLSTLWGNTVPTAKEGWSKYKIVVEFCPHGKTQHHAYQISSFYTKAKAHRQDFWTSPDARLRPDALVKHICVLDLISG